MSSKPKSKKKDESASTKKKTKSTKSVKTSESEASLSAAPSVSAMETSQPKSEAKSEPAAFTDYSLLPFEAGQIFSKFDSDGDGKLNKQEFTELVRQNLDLLRANKSFGGSGAASSSGALPMEVISNRLLTHFDETAGVAIARSEVEQHQRLGNLVTPLLDAYKSRYERLRTLLTGKLFPKREHLLQLRRQLQHTAAEVDSKRRSIERETLTDTEQILERLRTVESMRQSSIRHQVIQIEDELTTIERLVRRVERANIDESSILAPSSSVLLTSAQPGATPVESISAPRAASMVEVIQEYADLSSIIERLATKAITVQVDFPTDDFPKETSERLEVLARCDKYMHAVQVKDQMLLVALKERDQFEKSLDDERRLSQEYAQEVAHWAELADTLSHQLHASKQETQQLHERIQRMSAVMSQYNIFFDPSK